MFPLIIGYIILGPSHGPKLGWRDENWEKVVIPLDQVRRLDVLVSILTIFGTFHEQDHAAIISAHFNPDKRVTAKLEEVTNNLMAGLGTNSIQTIKSDPTKQGLRLDIDKKHLLPVLHILLSQYSATINNYNSCIMHFNPSFPRPTINSAPEAFTWRVRPVHLIDPETIGLFYQETGVLE